MTILKSDQSKLGTPPSQLAALFSSKYVRHGLQAGLVGIALTSPILTAAAETRPLSTAERSPVDTPAVQQAATNTPAQFQVNTYTTSYQAFPAIAMDGDGDFVLAWGSIGSSGTDTDGYSIQAQRYNDAGVPQSGQFQVNTYTLNDQTWPAIAMDANGDFMVAWHSDGSSGPDTDSYSIQAQRYKSFGAALGGQFQVNNETMGSQFFPQVAMDTNGDFVVAWRSVGSSGSDADGSIQVQRYDSSGSALGGQFQVNTYTTSWQASPSLAMNEGGGFVVVWISDGSSGSDTDGSSIQAQRYDSSGAALRGQFQVNTYTTGGQSYSAVAKDANGDFAVTWTSNGSSETDTDKLSIQAQRYNSIGVAQGKQYQVNTFTTGRQTAPEIAMDADGDFAVAWSSYGSSGTDTDTFSIQARRYPNVRVYLPIVVR